MKTQKRKMVYVGVDTSKGRVMVYPQRDKASVYALGLGLCLCDKYSLHQ